MRQKRYRFAHLSPGVEGISRGKVKRGRKSQGTNTICLSYKTTPNPRNANNNARTDASREGKYTRETPVHVLTRGTSSLFLFSSLSPSSSPFGETKVCSGQKKLDYASPGGVRRRNNPIDSVNFCQGREDLEELTFPIGRGNKSVESLEFIGTPQVEGERR